MGWLWRHESAVKFTDRGAVLFARTEDRQDDALSARFSLAGLLLFDRCQFRFFLGAALKERSLPGSDPWAAVQADGRAATTPSPTASQQQ